jgi:hypothetical protein
MAFCLNRDVIGECLIGQKIAKTKQRHKTHAHKRSAMVNGVVAGAGSLKHASGHTGPRRVGEFAEAHLFLRASCCEHVIEITGWVFAFKAAGETQRRGKKGTHPLFRRRVPTLSVFRQMSWMFDQIEREWFGPGKI